MPFSLRGAYILAVAVVWLVVALASGPVAADAKKIAYGKHLAAECTSCHRIDGVDNGIPSITGWDLEEFVSTIKFYTNGARNNPAMKSVADSLEDDQLEALAAFFATIPKPPKKN